MVGLCAQDMDDHSSYADFAYFIYQEKHTPVSGNVQMEKTNDRTNF